MAKTLRCAIYTRKSCEEGLEQEFNSLDAQRESCLAYIASQKSEGWVAIKESYDDGGYSGGNMDRPALKKLLANIETGRVNIVVVYKIDRLTRSLMDFAKLVEVFDKHGVTFVSVTQSFNTTTSMGRLTLNVLLSFAQFEREVTGERIRDKIAASKKKGIWMGGIVPLGYEVKERKLLIKPKEAETARQIYKRYLELGCVRLLQKELAEQGIRSVKGNTLSRGTLYKMLSNPIYIGQIRHKGICHTGQHEAIIDEMLWQQVQEHMAGNRIGNKIHSRKTEPSPLAGKLFDVSGERLVPVHANKKGRRYRYYISESLQKNPKDPAKRGWRLPGQELDKTVIQAALQILQDQKTIATTLSESDIPSKHLATALTMVSKITPETLIERFVERVELSPDSIRLTLSLASLVPTTDIPIKIIHDIPMQLRRRGVEMRMVVGNHPGSANVDQTLVRTIAQAHQWSQEILSGKMPTLTAIAKRENLDLGHVSRVINLAFLAPNIVEAIVAGRQPTELTAHKLLKQIDLPMDWAEQNRLLGIA